VDDQGEALKLESIKKLKPDRAAHTYSHSTQKAEAGRSQIYEFIGIELHCQLQVTLGYAARPYLQKKRKKKKKKRKKKKVKIKEVEEKLRSMY
jgi:hypothetical protein